MNFTHYNLGHVERGRVVVVTLSERQRGQRPPHG